MTQSKALWIATALGVALAFGCQSKEAPKEAPAETPAEVEKPELAKADGEIDRTVLPIVPPKYTPITELDARKAKAPPPFEVNAPEGAPNVVIVLVDDIGFGATETFGAGIRSGDRGQGGDRIGLAGRLERRSRVVARTIAGHRL